MSNRINDKAALATVGSDTNFAVDTPAGVKRVTKAVLQTAAAGVVADEFEITAAGFTDVTLGAEERKKFVAVSVVPGEAVYAHALVLPLGKAGDQVVYSVSRDGDGEAVTLRFSQFAAGTVLHQLVCPEELTVTAEFDGAAWHLIGDGLSAVPASQVEVAGDLQDLSSLGVFDQAVADRVRVLRDGNGYPLSGGRWYSKRPADTRASNGVTIITPHDGDEPGAGRWVLEGYEA